MSHTQAETVELTCPACSETFEAEIESIIDVDADEALTAHLRAGDVHVITCAHCDNQGQVDAPLLLYFATGWQRPAENGPAHRLVFSPASQTTQEQDNEHASALIARFAELAGEAWDPALQEQVTVVPRQLLPALFADDPATALATGMRDLDEAARLQRSPLFQAVLAFVQAPDEDAARLLYDQQRALLSPYEAQRLLEESLRGDSPEAQQRITDRAALLRTLRGAAPRASQEATTPAGLQSPEPLAGATVDPHVQDQRAYHSSAHAEGGGNATVVNNHFIQNLDRRWTRPEPPPFDRDVIQRPAQLAAAKAELTNRGSVAITSAVLASTLAVQGMPGVGKTVLARLLVRDPELLEIYTDGVLWAELGPDFDRPAQAQTILRTWAGCATDFFGLPENQKELFLFEPEAVRYLLAEHPRLLIVLDNVWSRAAMRPLQAAVPPGAHLIVTTRSAEIARGLGAGRVEVGLLTEEEAVDLFHLRLRWRPDRLDPNAAWAFDVTTAVGNHALGLDVALGVLLLYGDAPDDWQPASASLLQDMQSGDVDRLNLGDDDPGHDVKAVMMVSYQALGDPAVNRDADLQVRFRLLAAFAPEAEFDTAMAAGLWGCDADEAFETLTIFANAALLDRQGRGLWRQHGLLRLFALALLHDLGEYDSAAAAHAATYAAAMRAADDAQRHFEMLTAMPQLRHAFAWAAESDLNLAQEIISQSANLMAAFGLADEGLQWAEQTLTTAQERGTPEQVARAQGSLGNALSRVATLPDEDRRQRLYDALDAYDEALRHYRPDTAPLDYAMTQNNRATILSELATLPDEDRRQRLYDALDAYDEALRFRRPDTAPLDYAMTQNNRATILSELATLPDEDRRQRLYDALDAYDEALRFRRPDTAPLDYAATQNNRANILSELATLPDEDRRQRLYDALDAYDEALRHYRPDTAPLDYAMTQNNRATILSELATLPDEDRRQRLYDALDAYDEALRHYRPDTAPLDYAMTQGNLANLYASLADLEPGDRAHRQCQSIKAVVTALDIFQQVGHGVYAQQAYRQTLGLRDRFGIEAFTAAWAELDLGELPAWLSGMEND